jgi:hypothetical protein
LASPLLGPTPWQPVADRLRARGLRVAVVAHTGPAPASAAEVAASFTASLESEAPWVLVPHSNAGLFAPVIARTRHVRGVVYVDARLPAPGLACLSSPAALAFLATKVDAAGLLPPWHAWWDDDLAQLFPSDAIRRACEAEMRRLPLAYFRDRVDGDGWDRLPSAYLAFGTTYAAERERAAAAGWPTATIDGAEHLHMLVDPDHVAAEVARLMRSIGTVGSAERG